MKRIALIITAIAANLVGFAQENDSTLTHSVNIEKDYTPQVVKVKRIDIELPTSEPKVEKSAVVYSSETQPQSVQSQFYPLQPADAKNVGRTTYKPGFARLGIGFPLTWVADLWTPVINNKTDYLGVNLNHHGIINGTKKLIETDFDLFYNHHFRYGKLYSNIGFDNDFYSYYGTDSLFNTSIYYREDLQRDVAGVGLSPQTRTTTKAHAIVGFASEKELKHWSYDGNLAYEMLTSFPTIEKDYVNLRQSSTREHHIGLNLFGGYNLKGHHINADLNVEAYIYNAPKHTIYLVDSVTPQKEKILRDSTYAISDWKPQFLITFNPRYENKWGDVSLRAGAKLWFSINKGNIVAAAPDIEARYTFRQLFEVYGGIGGDYAFTSLNNTLEENRYYDLSHRLDYNDYAPVDFYVGFNIKPIHNLLFEASVSYKIIENTHFFYNQIYTCTTTPNVFPKTDLEYVYGNTFTADYAKAHLLTAEARLSYNLKERYNFHVKGKYNGWNVLTEGVEAWNKPAWEADAGIEALLTRNFALNANFYFASERTTKLPNKDGSFKTATLSPIYDLNLSMNYTFKKMWSVFLQANNLLSFSKELSYQQWYGYDNIGANILLGVSVGF